MARIIFEDIKSNKKNTLDKKSIFSEKIIEDRDIKKSFIIKNYPNDTSASKQRIERTPQIKKEVKIIRKPILIFTILLILIGGIYYFGNLFYKADIILTPKEQIIKYDAQSFIASKNSKDKGIEFEIMILSDKKLENITLTEPKEISQKAKGSIVLYNEFSSLPQKLLAGTFISDNEGKSYQTDDAVTIPGYSFDENKKIVPGQIIVNISSFLPGENYNGFQEDFYINSFKDTKKYDLIYGKLKNPIVGGALGLYYVPNESDKIKIENIAKTSLKEALYNQVKVLLPPLYVLYPNATNFSYTNNDNYFSKTPEAELEIEGNLTVILFKKESLSNMIIQKSFPGISKSEFDEIKITDLEALSFEFANKNQLITKDLDSVPFNLTGDINLIWNPDIDLLKTKLLGINKNQVLPILREDKGIVLASIRIFPPWKKGIPLDLSKIKITTKK